MENEYTQCMEFAENKCRLTFVLKGNGVKTKWDPVRNEMKTIEQGILAHEAKKKKFLEK